MKSARSTNRITVIIGVALWLSIVAAGWFPRSCPVLQRITIGCPTSTFNDTIQSAEEKELNRVPHSTVAGGFITFSVGEQPGRERVRVSFDFSGELDQQVAMLQLQTTEGYSDIALVTHPLLRNLTWPKITQRYPSITVFQKDGTYTSMEEFLQKRPGNKNLVAADEPAAKILGLTTDSYTPLDRDLTTLGNLEYIVTSSSITQVSGIWHTFSGVYDLSNASTNDSREISLGIAAPSTLEQEDLRVGNVRVDFQERLVQ